jgi:cell division ATPase FtsA
MSFKISNIVDYNHFIALDIGTSKIKVLICSIEGGGLKVLGSSIMRQSKKNIIDGEIADLYGVSETIKKAISKAGENLDEIPSDIVISLGSILTFSDIIHMNYIRENPESPINMVEIDNIVKKVEHTSLDRVKNKILERTGIIESEMRLVTTSIISITVDGKKIGNPVGFTGKNIKLGVINVFVPLSYVNMIQNIGRGLSKNIISLVPSIITLPKLIEERDQSFDFNCCVDFGCSKTTIVIENRGEILGGNTLNFGFGLLEETFKRKEPSLGYLDIEYHISHIEQSYEKYKDIFDTFF